MSDGEDIVSTFNRILHTAGCGLLFALALACPGPAKAIEVQCIEASKYKYLYQMFGNDRAKFAEFLRVSASALPDGEICRAGIITGRIEKAEQAHDDGHGSDYKTLLSFIESNRGWLSQIYLASGGGNINMGLGLAELTRMFWLKTHSIEGKSFAYRPDFIPTAPVSQEWLNLAEITVLSGKGRCASACTFMHMAGIDRHGTAYVHRGRLGKPGDKSMTEIMDSLHRAEDKVLALYRKMDAGDEAIRLFQETTTHTVAPVLVGRFPRYVADLLRSKCGADADQAFDPQAVERIDIERCIVASHEKERLAQFGKYCRGTCDRAAIASVVKAKVNELAPPSATASKTPARR